MATPPSSSPPSAAAASAPPAAACASGPTSELPPKSEQASTIDQLIRVPLVEGETWYVIATEWYRKWVSYVRPSTLSVAGTMPGPIDNSRILENGQLRRSVSEHYDYELVPAAAWDLLVKWYGHLPDQRPIARLVRRASFYETPKVEVQLTALKLMKGLDAESMVDEDFPRSTTGEKLKDRMCQLFSLPNNETTRVREVNSGRCIGMTVSRYDNVGWTPATFNIEQKLPSGYWPSETTTHSSSSTPISPATSYTSDNRIGSGTSSFNRSNNRDVYGSSFTSDSTVSTTTTGTVTKYNYGSPSSSYSSSSNYDKSWSSGSGSGTGSRTYASASRGHSGLQNLGNTCFMNSALQCLSNCAPLREYFLSGRYKKDLNRSNPIGCEGRLAEDFAALLQDMWSGSRGSVSPRDVKQTISKFAPQFSGYQQHDSQELLGFMLDGLHEDTNRVLKKPYVETKERGDRTDEEASAEAWHNHKLRNDSEIVDLFQGQLKSTLVCPDCGKVSITFDPFMYLALPLPDKQLKRVELMLRRCDPRLPWLKCAVLVPSTGSMAALKEALTSVAEVRPADLVVVDMYNHRIYKEYDDSDSVGSINATDHVVVYEIPPGARDDRIFRAVLRVKSSKSSNSGGGSTTSWGSSWSSWGWNNSSYTYNDDRNCGTPLFIRVPAGASYEDLCRIIRVAVGLESGESAEPAGVNGAGAAAASVAGAGAGPNTSGNGAVDEDGAGSDEDVEAAFQGTRAGKATGVDSGSASSGTSSAHSSAHASASATPAAASFTIKVMDQALLRMVKEILPGKPVDIEDGATLAVAFDTEPDQGPQESHESMKLYAKAADTSLTIDECMQMFVRKEQLTANNFWHCPVCKQGVAASKEMELFRLPRILVVQLKRFSYNSYFRDKLSAFVDFPITDFKVGSYLKHPTDDTYDLFAVSNHMGGLGGGHYTAHAYNSETKEWLSFDDSYVSAARADDAKSVSSYVLFYIRRDANGGAAEGGASAAAADVDGAASAAGAASGVADGSDAGTPDEPVPGAATDGNMDVEAEGGPIVPGPRDNRSARSDRGWDRDSDPMEEDGL